MRRGLKKLMLGVSAMAIAALLGMGNGQDVVKAAGYTSVIQACAINGNNVVVTAAVPAGTPTDDNVLYLFEMPTYAAGLTGSPVATAPYGQAAAFTVPLNQDQANSRLYSKFAVAVKSGGAFVQITDTAYIGNPEAIAKHTMAYPEGVSKKGLLVSPTQYNTNEIADLGVKQVTYDVPINRLFGPTTNGSYPTINYKYNGKNYQFDGFIVAQYDHVFKNLTQKGVVVTAILLNELDPTCMQTTHPLARTQTTSPYYMFNAADASGVEHLAAAASFLSSRYSDIGVGRVHNWIIGNEITARSQWNYIAPMDVTTYTEEYAKALRVFYTAIKSSNANARVFISLDQTWNRNLTDGTGYDGRDIIDALSANSIAHGNFDWGVAIHPYGVPLTWAAFWNMPPQYAAMKLVTNTADSPMITAQNISVFTDYMCQPQNLSRTGAVRNLMVSEVGFPSAQGENVQAAAIVYAYYNVAYNQHIDAFILARDIDSPTEVAQGLNMGLRNADGSNKLAYSVYKSMDTNPAAVEGLKAVIGISEWSQVVQAR
ncbi:MAG: hypothetical protein J6B10_08735 [Lachnospiraceae bacterium]|nr:hypothetical protein [Lachnospiraceae bacterium]